MPTPCLHFLAQCPRRVCLLHSPAAGCARTRDELEQQAAQGPDVAGGARALAPPPVKRRLLSVGTRAAAHHQHFWALEAVGAAGARGGGAVGAAAAPGTGGAAGREGEPGGQTAGAAADHAPFPAHQRGQPACHTTQRRPT